MLEQILDIQNGWISLCNEQRDIFQERLEKQFALFEPPAISLEKIIEYEKILLRVQDIEQRIKEYRRCHGF